MTNRAPACYGSKTLSIMAMGISSLLLLSGIGGCNQHRYQPAQWRSTKVDRDQDTSLPGTTLPGTTLPGTTLPGTTLPGTTLTWNDASRDDIATLTKSSNPLPFDSLDKPKIKKPVHWTNPTPSRK